MPRKKKKDTINYLDTDAIAQTNQIIEQHLSEIDTNPEYSLEVDPENKYNMTDEQKKFVKLYADTKSLQLTQVMMGIPTEIANAYFISYSCQQEIRRLNRAMLQRRFQSKMLSLNQIGGYLSTLITEEDVPLTETLKPREKVAVAGMLIELNKLKAQSAQDPNIINYKDVEEVAKNMSIDAIRAMLNSNVDATAANSEKDVIISKINKDNVMLPEEIDYLKSLSTVELMQLLNNLAQK